MACIQAWRFSSHRDGNRFELEQAGCGVIAFDFSDDMNVKPLSKRARNIATGQVKIVIIHITEMKVRTVRTPYISGKDQIVESCLV